jgi:hypothetical protein
VPVPESDISVLIPTYRYRDKVTRAVESALASGAGEIIVVDDRGQDGTMDRLSAYSDPRLVVVENERNLGLWENHLRALGMARKPWIKFIQADDYLLPGGLAAYAAAADDGVTVVWGAPMVKDDQSDSSWLYYTFDRPRRVTRIQIQKLCLLLGWVLGSPSHMMLRSTAIETDSVAWETRISADLVIGSIAAARGDTVLLPPGAIGQGAHPLQDVKTQAFLLGLERACRSMAYLRARREPGLRRIANLSTMLNLKTSLRTVVAGIVRREATAMQLLDPVGRMIIDLKFADWREILNSRKDLAVARRFRTTARAPFDLDEILDRIDAGVLMTSVA